MVGCRSEEAASASLTGPGTATDSLPCTLERPLLLSHVQLRNAKQGAAARQASMPRHRPASLPSPPPRRLLQVQLPNAEQREAILRLTLARHAKEIGPGYLDPELLPDPPQPAGTQQLAIGDGSAGGSGGGGAPADGAAGSGSNSGALVASSSGSGGGGAPTLRWLAQQTDGFSGSDLVQLCSQAAAVPIQDLIE